MCMYVVLPRRVAVSITITLTKTIVECYTPNELNAACDRVENALSGNITIIPPAISQGEKSFTLTGDTGMVDLQAIGDALAFELQRARGRS